MSALELKSGDFQHRPTISFFVVARFKPHFTHKNIAGLLTSFPVGRYTYRANHANHTLHKDNN